MDHQILLLHHLPCPLMDFDDFTLYFLIKISSYSSSESNCFLILI
nr:MULTISPECIES: hypothetical protein [Lactobacillus]